MTLPPSEDRAVAADAAEPEVSAVPASIPSALKAYAVLEEFENTGGIVYAKSAIEARRIGANEYADGDFSAVSCKRAPWADRYIGKGLPIHIMVENGWHFDCQGCGRRIDSDYLWETDRQPEDIVGHQHSACYCDAVCEARETLDRAERKRLENRWLRRFAKIVKRRFPDAAPTHRHAYCERDANGRLRIGQVSVEFDFPGRQYSLAQLRWDRDSSWKADSRKPSWSCSSGDREAFEAYAAQGIEARQGGDGEAGSVHESPVPNGDAPND